LLFFPGILSILINGLLSGTYSISKWLNPDSDEHIVRLSNALHLPGVTVKADIITGYDAVT
jgi:thioester reductase-like protein